MRQHTDKVPTVLDNGNHFVLWHSIWITSMQQFLSSMEENVLSSGVLLTILVALKMIKTLSFLLLISNYYISITYLCHRYLNIYYWLLILRKLNQILTIKLHTMYLNDFNIFEKQWNFWKLVYICIYTDTHTYLQIDSLSVEYSFYLT